MAGKELMPARYALPECLSGRVEADAYNRWLQRKAEAHVKRDRKRLRVCSVSAYKQAIHQAVGRSQGNDAYTGEALDWGLISTYRNDASKAGRHGYKSGFALLPTVDHIEADTHGSGFAICAWRTNDAKNDLSLTDFLEVCRKALMHAGYSVTPQG